MRKTTTTCVAAAALAACTAAFHAHAQTAAPPAKPVGLDTFVRAETDTNFAMRGKGGVFGKLVHTRTLASIDSQGIIRMNRDTLYSRALLDLDAGPVTITLPDAGKRYVSLHVI